MSRSGAAEGDGSCGWVVNSRSLSLALGFALDFCFAALTRALERNALESVASAEGGDCSGLRCVVVVELALLVAS